MKTFLLLRPRVSRKTTLRFSLVIILMLIISPLILVYPSGSYSDDVLSQLIGPLDPLDVNLIQYIRQNVLDGPSIEPNNLGASETTVDFVVTSFANIRVLVKRLYPVETGLKNGFFVEAGAYDGQFMSNSLYLEQELGWTGLLVEPDRSTYSKLRMKNRKAYSCQCCLSTKPYPFKTQLANFEADKTLDSLITIKTNSLLHSLLESKSTADRSMQFKYTHYENVQCFPIVSLLQAMNVSKIDLFSLDVEDVEVEILKTFPFDLLTVDVWIVEHRHDSVDLFKEDIFDEDFVHWFETKGYGLYDWTKVSPIDYTFIRKNSTIYASAFE